MKKFEQNINEVVAKYQNYAVTAGTIKDDKQVLADLRKLKKQLSDERIKVKRNSQSLLTTLMDISNRQASH
ncbi:PF07083 domain protein [Streptococcus pyogenes GA40468]|nr:PF07083 domain protein [Streptococcus pyogenes GA40468]